MRDDMNKGYEIKNAHVVLKLGFYNRTAGTELQE